MEKRFYSNLFEVNDEELNLIQKKGSKALPILADLFEEELNLLTDETILFNDYDFISINLLSLVN